ncbi:hypothetical protein C5C16_15260 [Rathayibacter rathayi]|nr:hypothetical protein C5C16_15260 [Rathayibacter rathayi]
MRETLEALERVFISAESAFWTRIMHAWVDELASSQTPADISRLAREIIHMYGGMGTFNDVLIYTNGTYPRDLNEELDLLRGELYEIALTLA